jgi:hypothetical protein
MIGGGRSDSFWFSSNVSNILGDGHSIKFLIENWLLGLGMEPEVFPLFFAKMTLLQRRCFHWIDDGWK